MKRISYIILTALILNGCATPAQQGNRAYFPPAVFESRPDLNAFIDRWYSGQLRALEEDPLLPKTKDKNNEIYRFTCLRTFHNPFTIRIEVVKGNQGILIRKSTSGKGGYEPGSLKESQSTDLSKAAIKTLHDLIDKIGFWDLPTTRTDIMGLDGSQWIVEAVKDGKYHIVDRWSPDPGTDMRTLGECFLSLAAWQPDRLY
jgi:hypothetical protein